MDNTLQWPPSTNLSKSLNWIQGIVVNIKLNRTFLNINNYFTSDGLKTVQSVQCASTITQVCFHPNDPSRFAIIGEDKNVELWDVRGNISLNDGDIMKGVERRKSLHTLYYFSIIIYPFYSSLISFYSE
jgi:WD40 repeat protein